MRARWERNFCLKDDSINREKVREILTPKKGRNQETRGDFYKKCRDYYRMDVLKDRKYSDLPPRNLQSELDGVAWE